MNRNSKPVARRSLTHEIRGVRYKLTEWGDREDPLLVLLHGWGDAGTTFQFVVDQLQQDWFVVAPDWRGFGDSECPAQSFWFPDYIADLDVLLGIYSAKHPVVLVGHSMGANIAGLYAGIFPERVAAFVNIEGFGLPDRDPEDAPANYRRWIERGRQALAYKEYESFDELSRRIMKRGRHIPETVAGFVARQWGRPVDGGRIAIKANPAHKLPNAVLYRRREAAACWSRIEAPVVAIVGAESEFRNHLEAEFMPFDATRSVTIENAGHMIHFEQPQALAAAIEDFLQSV